VSRVELGHARRSKSVIASVRRTLGAHGLSIDLSVDRPRSLDDEVSVALAPVAPVIEPAPVLPALRPTVDLTLAAERAIAPTIEVRVRTSEGEASGAGFVIDPDGLAVTACHVVVGDAGILRRVRVRLANGRRTMCTVVRAHPKIDFAVLWLDSPGPHSSLSIGDPRALLLAGQAVGVIA
jgi:S1-C subfamily serine protease